MMTRTKFYTLLLLCFSKVISATAEPLVSGTPLAPIVDLGFAQYQGFFDATSNTTQFLGLRYGDPPTGASRFHAPRTPSNISGIQLANAQPATCMQSGTGAAPVSPVFSKRQTGSPLASEDCLFLNVYAPGTLPASREPLPVVVWIHGGGYVAGSASQFDGTQLLREAEHGVVAVIIQYRLGLFGFLAGEKVKQGGVLNAGLRKSLSDLAEYASIDFVEQWIKNSLSAGSKSMPISQFGGDPTKVTIWGESAGAGSVLQHVIARGGKTEPPLFRGAMTSSTFLPSQYPFDGVVPEALFSEAVSQAGCSTAQDTLECLRTTDVGILEGANVNIALSAFFGTFAWVPVIDGEFIVQSPLRSFTERKINGERLLSVTNAFEGSIFVNTSSPLTVPEYVANLFPLFGPGQIAGAVAQYEGLGDTAFQTIAIMGESIFICPTYAMLRAFSGRSFKGEFAIPPGIHGSDVAYYFGDDPPFNNPAFDDAFSESFLNFVMALNPNVKPDPTDITPHWNTWNQGETEMLFNKTDATPGDPVVVPLMTSEALLGRCSFWESVAPFSGQ